METVITVDFILMSIFRVKIFKEYKCLAISNESHYFICFSCIILNWSVISWQLYFTDPQTGEEYMLRRGECVNVLPGILKKVYSWRKAESSQIVLEQDWNNLDQLLLFDTILCRQQKSQIPNSVLKSAEKNYSLHPALHILFY